MRAADHYRWARTTGTSWSGRNADGRTDGEGEEMLSHRRETVGLVKVNRRHDHGHDARTCCDRRRDGERGTAGMTDTLALLAVR